MTFSPEKKHILSSGISNPVFRQWQGLNCGIEPNNLMYPLFIVDDDNAVQPIESMPGVMRFGINKLKAHLDPLISKGLSSVLLFGVLDHLGKDLNGTNADSSKNPVVRLLPQLRSWFPQLIVACDVCLCPYTSHGHCGILNTDGTINNQKSIERLSQIALTYAKAGAHIVAPSDMMDGRIGAIKSTLGELTRSVAVLSYTAKFASGFYGPFRTASKSAPAFGDRRCYQLPVNSFGLAMRAVERDVQEGADILMVKPGLAYLDVVAKAKRKYPEYPMFIYQVSGEYAMIHYGAKAGVIDFRTVLEEILTSMRRSGADVIITYFTPTILEWITANKKSKL